jgi:hypothetical protein
MSCARSFGNGRGLGRRDRRKAEIEQDPSQVEVPCEDEVLCPPSAQGKTAIPSFRREFRRISGGSGRTWVTERCDKREWPVASGQKRPTPPKEGGVGHPLAPNMGGLLRPKGLHWVDGGRAAGGYESGQACGDRQHSNSDQDAQRIVRMNSMRRVCRPARRDSGFLSCKRTQHSASLRAGL